MIQSYDLGTTDDGFEWLTSVSGDVTTGFFSNISFLRADSENVTTANSDSEGITYTSPNFYKNTTDNGTYNSYLITDDNVNKGCWNTYLTIAEQTTGQTQDVSGSSWIYGLAGYEAIAEEGTTGLLESMLVCFTRRSDGSYGYKKGVSIEPTNIQIEVGDIISISKKLVSTTETKVVYTITKGTQETDFDGDIIQTSELLKFAGINDYKVLLKVANDTGKIAFTNIKFNPTPSTLDSNGVVTSLIASDVPDVLRDSNLLEVGPSPVSIDFVTEDLQLLLGYSKKYYIYNGVSGKFFGVDGISTNIFNNDMIVEIPELPLDGYDHGYKQSRNIAMVITASELKNSQKSLGNETYELSYSEQATFLFIGIKNKQTTVTCPQLSIRVTSEGSLIPMTGKMTCLLLFRDEEDKL
jgi:hypothetical protein